jgi:hypothetical protein
VESITPPTETLVGTTPHGENSEDDVTFPIIHTNATTNLVSTPEPNASTIIGSDPQEPITATPVPIRGITRNTKIIFTARLLMPVSSFTQDIQRVYRGGVARVMNVDISKIAILSIKSVQLGRRLLTESTEVETAATVREEDSQSSSDSVSSENMNNELESEGMSVGEVSEPTSENEIVCGPGMYKSFDKTACVTCPAGMYSETEDASSFSTCIACDLSTYSATIGATGPDTCIACETGKTTFKKGSKYIRQCKVSPSQYIC